MRKHLWILAALATIGSGRPLRGQEAVFAPALVTFVREVLEQNGAVAAGRQRVGAAGRRIAPAGALPDPTVGLGVTALPVPSFAFAAEPMTQVPIRVEQRFPLGGKLAAAVAVARADSGSAAANLEVVTSRLAADAAAAWFELAYTRRALEIARGRAALADRAVLAAQARYETGSAPQTDLLRARLRRAEVADEERRLEGTEVAATSRADALRNGQSGPIDATLTIPREAARNTAVDDSLPENENAELLAVWADVERARRQAESLAIAARPDLTVSVQNGIRFGGREPFLTALVGISVPLWAGRKQTPLARAASLDAEAALARYQDERARRSGQLRAESANLAATVERVTLSTEQIVPLAEAASASALQRYQVGTVEFSAVLATQDDTFRAQLNQARLLADYGAARARLALLVGEEWYR